MSCYHPLKAFRRSSGEIGFSEAPCDLESLELPCGRCLGCRLNRASSWSIRCMHEASLYSVNSFVTLTYDDDHLPLHGSLDYRDVQKFLKRFRKSFSGIDAGPKGNFPIRFFCAGEYGSKSWRPHFHLLLFNIWLRDCARWGKDTFTSASLERLWPYGQSVIGSVTSRSAAYVARYSLKKVLGRQASDSFYNYVDERTGECCSVRPEFCTMSRKPGLGAWWYDKFCSDVLPVDYAVMDGAKRQVPRYYVERFRAAGWVSGCDSLSYEAIKEARYEKFLEMPMVERSEARRVVKECVKSAELFHYHGEREPGYVDCL